MSDSLDNPISITLSPAQVDHVLRAASHSTAPGIAALVGGARMSRDAGAEADTPSGARVAAGAEPVDRRLSRSLLRGLSILNCFERRGQERGIVELARASGMSPSTTHRYAQTLIELGLLERSPRSRKYMLPADLPG